MINCLWYSSQFLIVITHGWDETLFSIEILWYKNELFKSHWGHFSIKMCLYQCKISHYKDKSRLSYLHNGNYCTWKDGLLKWAHWFRVASWYWCIWPGVILHVYIDFCYAVARYDSVLYKWQRFDIGQMLNWKWHFSWQVGYGAYSESSLEKKDSKMYRKFNVQSNLTQLMTQLFSLPNIYTRHSRLIKSSKWAYKVRSIIKSLILDAL